MGEKSEKYKEQLHFLPKGSRLAGLWNGTQKVEGYGNKDPGLIELLSYWNCLTLFKSRNFTMRAKSQFHINILPRSTYGQQTNHTNNFAGRVGTTTITVPIIMVSFSPRCSASIAVRALNSEKTRELLELGKNTLMLMY